jgi:protein-tyrosine phosphatase
VLDGRARQVEPADLRAFDYILAMDADNLARLERLKRVTAPDAEVRLFRSFDPTAGPGSEVPDPYYGGARGFEDVFDMIERAGRGLLEHIRREHGL